MFNGRCVSLLCCCCGWFLSWVVVPGPRSGIGVCEHDALESFNDFLWNKKSEVRLPLFRNALRSHSPSLMQQAMDGQGSKEDLTAKYEIPDFETIVNILTNIADPDFDWQELWNANRFMIKFSGTSKEDLEKDRNCSWHTLFCTCFFMAAVVAVCIPYNVYINHNTTTID